MVMLKVENAWVEFPVPMGAVRSGRVSKTGGRIDIVRGVVTALRDISFELREGDRLGLIGHNGAGKSTMLRLLAGAYAPTRGRVTSIGRVSTLFNATPGLSLDGTGRENLVTCGLHLGMTRKQIDAKMDEIIDFAELGDYIDLPVRIYSTGMLTRLGFSIATAVDPEILLLDEGLATGDAQFAQKAHAKLNDLIDRSSILVIASHSETLISSICSRCLMIEHGSVLYDGPADSVVESYRSSVVESARANDPEGLIRAYMLATDMAKRGIAPPLDLEEQGLRHALTIAPDDAGMLERYVTVLTALGKPVPADDEARLLFAYLVTRTDRAYVVENIAKFVAQRGRELSPDLAAKARAILEQSPT